MTAIANKLSIAGLAIAGSLGVGATAASAQAVYVDPYVPVVVAPGAAYVAPMRIVAPPPIVRERVVVARPAYVPAPVYSAPLAPYEYSGYGYAADVVVDPGW